MARSIVGPGPYPRRTEYSLTSYEELVTQLAEIQRLGYAVDRQELNLGVWCVAAPILGVRQTQPAAVSVSAYRPHLDAAEEAGAARLHVAVDGGFAPVDELAAAARLPGLAGLRDVGDLYARGADAIAELRELAATATASVAPDGVRYAPPVIRPGKIVCVGLNYADHIAESRTAKPDRIVLFAKCPSCLVAHGDAMRYPAAPTELDA